MNFKKILLVIIIFMCGYVIYKLSTFKLFNDENVVIKEINVPKKEYNLKIYYIPSNATNQSYIQVRTQMGKRETVLESFERYNFLNKYEIEDNTLEISISDTSGVVLKKDIKIKLP